MLYSVDRQLEAEIAIDCLSECDGFKKCQKILCVDGASNFFPHDFQVLEIKRPQSGFYCWAKMWDEAIANAIYEKILYIDCDRIFPIDSLNKIYDSIRDNVFVFPRWLYSFRSLATLCEVKKVRDNFDESVLIADHRIYSSPWESIRKKNPMSGCVGFTKNSFITSGGLDYDFQGWGYPDTDYFEKTSRQGMIFAPLDIIELHLKHSYSESFDKVKAMNLWNGIHFCEKWGYSIHPKLYQIADEIDMPISMFRYSDNLQDFLEKLSTNRAIKIL